MILSQMSNLQQRLIVSSACVTLLLFSIYLSYTPAFSSIFVLLIGSSVCCALWEYYHIAQLKGFQPLSKIGLIGSMLYTFVIFFTTQTPHASFAPYVVMGLTVAVAFLYYFIKGSDPFVNLAITFFGIVYLTIPLGCLILINYFTAPPLVSDGRWCLIYLVAVAKLTDTGAFAIGKLFGRTQLSPYISPKKTWEGACGGLITALVASLTLYGLFHLFQHTPFNITLWQSIWIAILISITAQFGDLAESLLKRNMGVKDSSHLPGLGGFLDIVDSLVFTAPLMYALLKLL